MELRLHHVLFLVPLNRQIMVTAVCTSFVLLIAISARAKSVNNESAEVVETTELPEPISESDVFYISTLALDLQSDDQEARTNRKNISAIVIGNASPAKLKNKRRKNSTLNQAIQLASVQGLNAMFDLYERKEPEILRKGQSIKLKHKQKLQILKLDPKKNVYRWISRCEPSGCAVKLVQCTNDKWFRRRG